MAQFTRALERSKQSVRITRGLRFRLTASFLIFFTVLLLGLGFIVRQMLVNIVMKQAADLLDEEWAASKGYLRIDHELPIWMFDRFDPEEAIIVNRIQGGPYLFADAEGNVVDRSTAMRLLGIDNKEAILIRLQNALKSPQQPLFEIRYNDQGSPVMLRYGNIPDSQHHNFLLVIGRSLADSYGVVNKFTTRYFAIVPVILLLCGAVGWGVAGRALIPVTEVAQAARSITGTNLSVQIPLRGSGDELDQLIEAFNRMIERLNYSFEQMRQFSTDVSHELRTPLTAIRGQLEVALFTAETPDQYRDAMVNALQDVEQLSNIVRALLLLSQAESGQLVLQLTSINIGTMVADMVEQFQIPAEEAGIVLENAVVDDDVIIRADKTQMGRLISNLLSNSIKYTHKDGRIRVAVQRQDDTAVLWVEDTGIGIPAAKLPHIFDRFYRVRPSQSNPVQGLGLGLSFVAWIVNAHGGKVTVDSTEGKGTRFTVVFPMLAATAAEATVVAAGDHAKL